MALRIKYMDYKSWFHRVDPISKFVWVLCIAGLCILNVFLATQILMFVVVLVFAILAARTPFREVSRVIYLLSGLLIAWSIISPFQRLVGTGTPLFVIDIFGMKFAAWQAGLMFGLAMGFRFFTFGIAGLTFAITTYPSDFAQALSKYLPYRLTHSIVLGLVLLPIVEEEMETIGRAQKLRAAGIKIGLGEKIANIFRGVFILMARGVRRAQSLALAMDSRGFGAYKKRVFFRDVIYPRSGLILRYGSIIVLILYAIIIFFVLGINPWSADFSWGGFLPR